MQHSNYYEIMIWPQNPHEIIFCELFMCYENLVLVILNQITYTIHVQGPRATSK